MAARTHAAPLDALAPLGPAAVDEETLTGVVADLLEVPRDAVRLREVVVEPVEYDLEAITTAGRHWVRGEAVVGDDQDVRPFSLFVKRVQCWSRHPYFAFVPPEHRAFAAAALPWRTEPDVYRSDLADRLPEGLSMPRALLVADLDELSAAVWLAEVAVLPAAWDLDRYTCAAHLMGRFAASPAVRGTVDLVGHDTTVWDYLHGRLTMQVLPAVLDDGLWHHPLLAPYAGLRGALQHAARRAEELTTELAVAPVRASHGDACPNNLLVSPGGDGFVLIDHGFLGPGPVGFDLGQLLVGEVQTGRSEEGGAALAVRDEACLAAYVDGLRAEGDDTPLDVVHRAHALQLVLYSALSSVPLEHLGDDPTPELLRVCAQRAGLAAYCLDLLRRTDLGTHDGP